MTLNEMVKDSPIYTAAALTFWGISLNDWVMILGLLYAAARVLITAFEFYWKWKDRRDGRNRNEARRAAREARLDAATKD